MTGARVGHDQPPTRFVQFTRNGWGKITSEPSTYPQSGGGIGTRTRTITYGSDGMDPTHIYTTMANWCGSTVTTAATN